MGTQATDKVWLDSVLASIHSRKFFGRLTLIFENGSIRRVVKEESIMPPRRHT